MFSQVMGTANEILFTEEHFHSALAQAATIAAGCGGDSGAREIIQFLQCHGRGRKNGGWLRQGFRSPQNHSIFAMSWQRPQE